MKRMIHPQHGAHNAMNANEEQSMRENGWVAEDAAPPAPPEIPIPAAEDAAPPAPVSRRGGRPRKDKA